MDQVIKLVVERTGISEDLATKAVATVLEFLKGKLPPALSGQLDGLLAGGDLGQLGGLLSGSGLGDLLSGSEGKDQAGDLLQGLGGLLGKK